MTRSQRIYVKADDQRIPFVAHRNARATAETWMGPKTGICVDPSGYQPDRMTWPQDMGKHNMMEACWPRK